MATLILPKPSSKDATVENIDSFQFVKEAIRSKKVYLVEGYFPAIIDSLRKRGWAGTYTRIPEPPKEITKSKQTDGKEKSTPWNDDVRTDTSLSTPADFRQTSETLRIKRATLRWRTDAIDPRYLVEDQMFNHFCNTQCFTTKFGLCKTLGRTRSSKTDNPNHYYPRSYRPYDQEKKAFVDDFRLTACISILKIAIGLYKEAGDGCKENYDNKIDKSDQEEKDTRLVCSDPECTKLNLDEENLCEHVIKKLREETEVQQTTQESSTLRKGHKSQDSYKYMRFHSHNQNRRERVGVPQKCLDIAIVECEKYLQYCSQKDSHKHAVQEQLSQEQWNRLLTWYYELAHNGSKIPNVSPSLLKHIETLLSKLKVAHPQIELDGTKNIWIVKYNRRDKKKLVSGLICYKTLDVMLDLFERLDEYFVVQKYIERPLLIYNNKFDVRQWFLVTDWCPLTVYFYKGNYIRFCSQPFTLSCRYNHTPKSKYVQEHNVWTNETFSDYAKSMNLGNLWDEKVYPCMKKAIVSVLLSSQQIVQKRKASFELYDADFMLSEDYKPWLIEITSNLTVPSNCDVITKLWDGLLDDTIKVVIDRKSDRNCDIGKFELGFTQADLLAPAKNKTALCVTGKAVKKQNGKSVYKSDLKHSNQETQSPSASIKRVPVTILANNSKNVVNKTNNERNQHMINNTEESLNPKQFSPDPVIKSPYVNYEKSRVIPHSRMVTSGQTPESAANTPRAASKSGKEINTNKEDKENESRSPINNIKAKTKVEKLNISTSPRVKQVSSQTPRKVSNLGSNAAKTPVPVPSQSPRAAVSRNSVSPKQQSSRQKHVISLIKFKRQSPNEEATQTKVCTIS